MAITTLDGLINSLGNSSQTHIVNKSSVSTQLAGGYTSLWRISSVPAAGAIPGAAAVCTNATTGGLPIITPAAGTTSYLARGSFITSVANTDIYIHDRLAHMGGLNATTTTAQTVGVDVSGSGSNLVNRRGASDYSEVQWWIEIYTDIGTTGVTATVTYTNAAGTTGRTTTVTLGGASPANQDSRMFPIVGNGGEYIQSIQSITHATTGTAGSYGITATRMLTSATSLVANGAVIADWATLGLPRVHDSACLFFIINAGHATTGTVRGSLRQVFSTAAQSTQWVQMTAAEYAALGTPDPNTLYIIVG